MVLRILKFYVIFHSLPFEIFSSQIEKYALMLWVNYVTKKNSNYVHPHLAQVSIES